MGCRKLRLCCASNYIIRSTSHYIVRSCACRKLRLCTWGNYIIRSSGNVCIASCGRLRVLGASYHRNGCLEPSVRGALLEGHLFLRPVWPWTWFELSTSCVGVQIFAYHLMTSFNLLSNSLQRGGPLDVCLCNRNQPG